MYNSDFYELWESEHRLKSLYRSISGVEKPPIPYMMASYPQMRPPTPPSQLDCRQQIEECQRERKHYITTLEKQIEELGKYKLKSNRYIGSQQNEIKKLGLLSQRLKQQLKETVEQFKVTVEKFKETKQQLEATKQQLQNALFSRG